MVSVILPNYNHAKYLKQRIESILNQTYQNIELIILDDLSLDDSREIINSYRNDKRVSHLVFNNLNSGSVFKQWEKGIKLAKGKYIWIAESDDYAEHNFLETLVPLMEDDDTLTFAYTDSAIVNEQGKVIGKVSDIKHQIFKTDHWYKDFIVDGQQELKHYLSLECTVNNASAVLFRHSTINEIGGIDTSFRFAGDWLTYIKLSLKGYIAYRSKCLNYYREHEQNVSKNSLKDGSLTYERQKCFAFIYHTNVLDNKSLSEIMDKAFKEYIDLQYNVVKKNRQYIIMLGMIAKLCKISITYYLRVQYLAVKMPIVWKC